MNYALTSNHPLGSIYVNLLDHLELRLDLLPSLLHKKDRPLSYREGGPLLYRRGLVKADVDVPRVRPDRVPPAVFLQLYLWLFQ